MLPAFISHTSVLLAQAGSAGGKIFHWDESIRGNIEIFLRWIHYFAGITWIGLLYFFNFVNGSFQKQLDGPTKGKVVPQLMPRALWWFRWGALFTVLAGLAFFIMLLHHNQQTWMVFGRWAGITVVTYLIIFALLRPVSSAFSKGWTLAVATFIVVSAMTLVMLVTAGSAAGTPGADPTQVPYSTDNHTLAISIGGGLGIIMMLNVWGIIWPANKRIIAWTDDNAKNGTAIPGESAALARRAFLASRMNTWLSVPMLFLMGAASHFSIFGR